MTENDSWYAQPIESDSMIARVARAIGGTEDQARAAIEEMRCPTAKMEEAGDYEIYERAGNGDETWRVMIEAALSPHDARGAAE